MEQQIGQAIVTILAIMLVAQIAFVFMFGVLAARVLRGTKETQGDFEVPIEWMRKPKGPGLYWVVIDGHPYAAEYIDGDWHIAGKYASGGEEIDFFCGPFEFTHPGNSDK